MSQNGSNLGPGRRRKIDAQKEVRRQEERKNIHTRKREGKSERKK